MPVGLLEVPVVPLVPVVEFAELPLESVVGFVVPAAPGEGDVGLLLNGELDVLGPKVLEFELLDPPTPVPIVDGPSPGPEGLRPPTFVTFCPKNPTAGRA